MVVRFNVVGILLVIDLLGSKNNILLIGNMKTVMKINDV